TMEIVKKRAEDLIAHPDLYTDFVEREMERSSVGKLEVLLLVLRDPDRVKLKGAYPIFVDVKAYKRWKDGQKGDIKSVVRVPKLIIKDKQSAPDAETAGGLYKSMRAAGQRAVYFDSTFASELPDLVPSQKSTIDSIALWPQLSAATKSPVAFNLARVWPDNP